MSEKRFQETRDFFRPVTKAISNAWNFWWWEHGNNRRGSRYISVQGAFSIVLGAVALFAGLVIVGVALFSPDVARLPSPTSPAKVCADHGGVRNIFHGGKFYINCIDGHEVTAKRLG